MVEFEIQNGFYNMKSKKYND